jgi:hypothetical protein
VDISGQVYITGETNSNNFDITAGAFQTTNAGGKDVFITKLNATGSGLIYSTYLGGSSNEQGYSITVDSSENAYVTGITESTNFDTTAGAFKTTNSGFMDVFATKINATGSSLIFSTYLGGSGYDRGHSIGLDANGNTYITGGTSSSNYDTTSGAFQTTYGGGADDIFVSKLNATGSVLLYSTYLGGSNNDFGRTLAIDGSGNAYITGFTDSPDFDTTAGAFQTTFGGSLDVFVSKLNASGTALIYSTFLGGSGQDVGRFIVLDGNENAYVSGNVTSTDFDITPGAFQTTNDGSWDVFVTQLNASGSGLLYSTYLGGSDIDYGVSIAIDGIGNVYSAGITNSTNFDITPGAFQTTNGGNYDVYVTKLGLSVPTSNIEYQTKLNSFSIYPNPTNGTFNILSEKGGVFELMDMAGRVLNTYKVNQGNYSIKEQLPTGMYLIRERESGSTLKLEVN